MTRLNLDTESLRHEIARLRQAERTAATLQHNACVQLRLALDYLREAKAADIRLAMLEKIDRALSVVSIAEQELTPTGVLADEPCEDVICFGPSLEANGRPRVPPAVDPVDEWSVEDRLRQNG